MDDLIEKARERFKKEAEPNWRLNDHILQAAINRFKSMLDIGLLDNEDQVIRFSLVMATEFEPAF